MSRFIDVLRQPLISRDFRYKAHYFTWQILTGIVMIFGILKVGALGLDEPRLLLGYAIVFGLALLFGIFGVLQGIYHELLRRRDADAP